MSFGKILVVGAAEAGKSTLLSALCPGAMNLAVKGRTVSMDHATLIRGENRRSLVGVPGQSRFGPVREVLSEGAHGVVWVHRAGSPVDQGTAELMGQLARNDIRYLVVVNHHGRLDGENGWSVPPGLPAPTAFLETDLLRSDEALSEIQEEIWDLEIEFER